MALQAPLRILCLDGGGAKGLSSLCILRELMAQTRRRKESATRQKDASHLRPCDYFDLICGTGTGGLIAIMLGRLQYDIETAIEKYVELAEAVFESSSPDPRALFDHSILEKQMRTIIGTAPDGSKENAMFEDPRVTADYRNCRTFVCATRPEGSGRAAVRMRTYATDDNDPFDAQIWQVAMATSAAPTYFLPMDIKGIRYGDGRTGWNNPTSEAIKEADYIWPARPIGCLISIGTGVEDAIQLGYDGEGPSPGEIVGSVLDDVTPKEAFEIAVAQYCVNCAISCERTHEEVSSNWSRYDIEGDWKYVRLNVPQGMAKIGLQEWKKFHKIRALSEDYMESFDVRELKREIAARLISPMISVMSASTLTSSSEMAPTGRWEKRDFQKLIEPRQINATNLASRSTFVQSGRDHDDSRSSALVQRGKFSIPHQQSSKQDFWEAQDSSSSSAESGAQFMRPKIVQHSPKPKVPSPPVLKYGEGNTSHSVRSEKRRTSHSDDGDVFDAESDNFALPEVDLSCDYSQCSRRGTLPRGYLRDHYANYHREMLIKPWAKVPLADFAMRPRWWRCSLCLQKIILANEGRSCDFCSRAGQYAEFEATRVAVRHRSKSDGLAPARIEFITQNLGSHASKKPTQSTLTAVESEKQMSIPSQELNMPPSRGHEQAEPPQRNIWMPPEIPSHWTSRSPSALKRTNATRGHNRSRSTSAYKNSHNVPASFRQARDDVRRHKFYQQHM